MQVQSSTKSKSLAESRSYHYLNAVNTDEKVYFCDTCPKSFRRKDYAIKHQRIHTGERPYICEVQECLKSFTQSNVLRDHKRVHTGERPYICQLEGCFKSTQNQEKVLWKHTFDQ